MKSKMRFMLVVNSVILICGAVYYLILPVFISAYYIADPNLRGTGIPKAAWHLHKQVTKPYGAWAKQRLKDDVAGKIHRQYQAAFDPKSGLSRDEKTEAMNLLYNVPLTEWPVFSSVFYLMATENLQAEWEKDHSLSKVAPKEYARETIEATKNILIDKDHHWWVMEHWGENYLHRENVFFRSLIISGLTSYQKLTGNTQHQELLKDQVLTLADDLDKSKMGVLNDYPGECYPIDVFASIAMIKRGAELTGVDVSAFLSRAVRAYKGDMLDERGLIPYVVDAKTGKPEMVSPLMNGKSMPSPSRGVGNSYILIFAPELWPDLSKEWYRKYTEYFWQERAGAKGFREFPKDIEGLDFLYDVDAGPILFGYSPAANAFGIAGAKANGRLDHAYMLAAQSLAFSFPLPDGRWLGPGSLSLPVHAPYLGELNLLWLLTVTPHNTADIKTGGHIPAFVYIVLGLVLLFGVNIIIGQRRKVKKIKNGFYYLPAEKAQFNIWLAVLICAIIFISLDYIKAGAMILLIALYLPVCRKMKK